MKNILSLLVLASSVAFAQTAFAADATVGASTKTTIESPTAAVNQVAPGVTTGTSVSTTVTDTSSKPTGGTLKDGTKYEVGSDNTITLINPDGSKNVAPDGVLTNKDDTTFNVKEGKIVTQ
ncbi:MAG TPA: hypothetical protein VFT64_09160 [Rickettsiales bacterium]|nr:hypothetical protein [Rickettsiales bacterium]